MSIDLSEFHDIFFEECFEGLNVMESGMLNLDHGTDIEDINTIFRAAHSIKGGSASFGFMEISSFTHVMETLLDEMRSGHRAVTRPAVDLLLISVDDLRGMVDAAKAHTDIDQTRVSEVRRKLDSLLSGNPDAGGSYTESHDRKAGCGNRGHRRGNGLESLLAYQLPAWPGDPAGRERTRTDLPGTRRNGRADRYHRYLGITGTG